MIYWLEMAGLGWLGLTGFTILLRSFTGMILHRRTRRYSRLHAEVHGLRQQEQHLRRLRGEIDAGRRGAGSILLARPLAIVS